MIVRLFNFYITTFLKPMQFRPKKSRSVVQLHTADVFHFLIISFYKYFAPLVLKTASYSFMGCMLTY